MKTNENRGYEVFKVTKNWADRSTNLNLQNPQSTDIKQNLDKDKETNLESRLESKLSRTRDDVFKFVME